MHFTPGRLLEGTFIIFFYKWTNSNENNKGKLIYYLTLSILCHIYCVLRVMFKSIYRLYI